MWNKQFVTPRAAYTSCWLSYSPPLSIHRERTHLHCVSDSSFNVMNVVCNSKKYLARQKYKM